MIVFNFWYVKLQERGGVRKLGWTRVWVSYLSYSSCLRSLLCYFYSGRYKRGDHRYSTFASRFAAGGQGSVHPSHLRRMRRNPDKVPVVHVQERQGPASRLCRRNWKGERHADGVGSWEGTVSDWSLHWSLLSFLLKLRLILLSEGWSLYTLHECIQLLCFPHWSNPVV